MEIKEKIMNPMSPTEKRNKGKRAADAKREKEQLNKRWQEARVWLMSTFVCW